MLRASARPDTLGAAMSSRALSILLAVLLGSSAAACGSDDDEDAAKTRSPLESCQDTADAVAKAAQRCGQDYKANYDAFTAQFDGCASVKAVRDEASLRATCLPSLATITCEDLNATKLDDTCKGQLLK
jgi:hypothetical protein